MACEIQVTAALKNKLEATASIKALAVSTIVVGLTVSSIAILLGAKQAIATLTNNKLTATVELNNSGVNSEPCPIILCIDGGSAFTTVYPPINGLLNGGSA